MISPGPVRRIALRTVATGAVAGAGLTAYALAEARAYTLRRVTVPVLFDRRTGGIVSNESSEIIRMLNSAFDGVGAAPGDFYPAALRAEIDAVNERVYAPHTSAIQLYLRDRGVAFRVDSEFLVRHLGEGRRADGSEPTTLVQYHDAGAESPPEPGCVLLQVPPTGSAPGWPSMWLAVALSGPGVCR